MKNKSYIGIAFIILVFGIIFVPKIIDSVKNKTIVKNDRLNDNDSVKVKDTSLVVIGKAPSFDLINQDNLKITDKYYQGKVYVVEFFFANCETICPIMNQNMLQLQKAFSNNDNFGIASITIDPENDTPTALKAHAAKLGATHKNWNFLNGKIEYIMNLANKGFNLYAGKNNKAQGGFEHSGFFALIDKEGNIRCRKDKFKNPILYYEGIEQEGIDAIKEDIALLLKE